MKTPPHNRFLMGGFTAVFIAASQPASLQAALTWDLTTGNGATIADGIGAWTNGAGNWNNAGADTA